MSLLIIFALSMGGCAQSVHFPSASPSQRDMLTGQLYRPKGDGPFPAMVLLHGCSGMSDHHQWWAAWLQNEGYVALVVDSFFARHISNICGPQGWMTLGISSSQCSRASILIILDRHTFCMTFQEGKFIDIPTGNYDH